MRLVRRMLFGLLLPACVGLAQAQTEIRLWHAMGGAAGGVLAELVERFNREQKDYRLVAVHKGGYEQALAAALEGQRAGAGPHLVQVYEIGTAELMAARGAWRPLWQAAREAGEDLDAKRFLPAVAGYFSDGDGRLLALPFAISTPVLFYSKTAFARSGLDPERPPRTWYEMPKAMEALLEAGFACAYTTTWPAWVHVENMSTWHNQEFATRDNGLAGLDARLAFNTHLLMRHISKLSSWSRSGYFTYSGRRLEGERRFASGECAMLTASSASYAEFVGAVAFELGVAQLPYYDDVRGAPHHSLVGGAGLWVLAGKPAAETRGAVKFLAFLARPEIQREWHRRTGYVPATRAAWERARSEGFYAAHPAHAVAIGQLLGNAPTRRSRGIRLGEFAAIRAIVEEELEAVWRGERAPKLALDEAVARGNALLRRFEAAQRQAGTGVPARPPR
jgi:sn-glycerol 3-phosphate transport system substrate-binding protein